MMTSYAYRLGKMRQGWKKTFWTHLLGGQGGGDGDNPGDLSTHEKEDARRRLPSLDTRLLTTEGAVIVFVCVCGMCVGGKKRKEKKAGRETRREMSHASIYSISKEKERVT